MSIGELDILGIALRTAIYVGTTLAAGGLAFRWLNGSQPELSDVLSKQIVAGAALVLAIEPLRYLNFQLQISDGDLAMAMGPDMRWIAFETPLGQAALVRASGAALALASLKRPGIGVLAAPLLIFSYLLEGHTAASSWRLALLPLLALHLAVAHWWLGALPILHAATRCAGRQPLAEMTERFGRQAVGAVAVLAVAGALLLVVLTGARADLASPYQRSFLVKLILFTAIVMIAAVNKLVWTKRLLTGPDSLAHIGFRRSLTLEMGLAVAILAATAVVTSFPPAHD